MHQSVIKAAIDALFHKYKMDIIWEASAFIIDNSALLATACARRSSLELAWLPCTVKKIQNWVNNIFIPCQKRKPNEKNKKNKT